MKLFATDLSGLVKWQTVKRVTAKERDVLQYSGTGSTVPRKVHVNSHGQHPFRA